MNADGRKRQRNSDNQTNVYGCVLHKMSTQPWILFSNDQLPDSNKTFIHSMYCDLFDKMRNTFSIKRSFIRNMEWGGEVKVCIPSPAMISLR